MNKMPLDNYTSFEEKGQYFKFGEIKIDNNEAFNHYSQLLAVQNENQDFVFRGLSEAKYKLYNSAQRLWDIVHPEDSGNEDPYDDFIIEMISKCKKWNQGTLPRLLEIK